MIQAIHEAKYGKPVVRQPVPVRQDVRPLVTELESNKADVSLTESNKPVALPKGTGFNKVAYQREYMRKRRLAKKEVKEPESAPLPPPPENVDYGDRGRM